MDEYKVKYRKLLPKARELQARYEKAVEDAQRFETKNQILTERLRKLEDELKSLRIETQSKLDAKDDKLCKTLDNTNEEKNPATRLESLTNERDLLKTEVDRLKCEVNDFDNKLEQESEKLKLHEKKWLHMFKELKRQLALERKHNETLQKRIETMLKEDTPKPSSPEPEVKGAQSATSSTNENSSSNICDNSPNNSQCLSEGMLIEEQAALVERVAQLQHDKWKLEEKLSYLEQANSSLSEDLADRSDIIRRYFIDQATKTIITSPTQGFQNSNSIFHKGSITDNLNHNISEKHGLMKVVDFLKERSQVSSSDNDNITREATKKMQLMLEETLIKCLKLQENLDYVTSELNKAKS